MSESVINIVALIGVLIGVICIFWKRDVFKNKASGYVLTTSGFVVLSISLLIIYFVNR